jgi:hypothetical protein
MDSNNDQGSFWASVTAVLTLMLVVGGLYLPCFYRPHECRFWCADEIVDLSGGHTVLISTKPLIRS